MNLKQRKPGEWVIDFTLRGKRIRLKIKGTRRMAEQAITFERERIYRQKFGIPEPKKKISFEEYSKIYADNYTKEKKAPRNEMYIINRLNSFFKGRILYEITPGDVDRLKQKRKKAGKCNATINRDLSVLSAIFNKAIDSEDYGIYRNPVKKAGLLQENSHRERFLTREEIRHLMEAAESNSWGGCLLLFLTIALNTGMRKMEILGLKWCDVDFKKKLIKVTKERSKNKKTRFVPMNDVVYQELQKVDKSHEYIFYNRETKSHIKNIKTTFKHACKKAGIKNLTAHDLRHTAASFLVNDCGVSVAVASEILGHSKLEMTMKYVHSTPEHRQVGVERLGEIFKKSRHKVDKSPSTAEIQKPTSPHINVH